MRQDQGPSYGTWDGAHHEDQGTTNWQNRPACGHCHKTSQHQATDDREAAYLNRHSQEHEQGNEKYAAHASGPDSNS